MNTFNQFQKIQTIFQAALTAANPETAVANILNLHPASLQIGTQTIPLEEKAKLYLISVGKASIPMAQATLKILGDRLYKGLIITKEGAAAPPLPANVSLHFGSHPIATSKSFAATNQIETLLKETTAIDHIICLISGGASALLSQPRLPIKLWQSLNKVLLASGCPIQEFNAVRRQFDAVKGGGLATWAAPAACHTLLLSDVIGNNLEAIGSGPTIYADDPPQVGRHILESLGLENQFDPTEWQHIINTGDQPKVERFNQMLTYHIVGDVKKAAYASLKASQKLGYEAQILATELEGEAREMGKFLAAIGKEAPPNTCYIFGGEATVTLKGSGMGGRNSELALSAAIALNSRKKITIASLSTDGDDGATKMAGFVVDGQTVANGRQYHLNPQTYLHHNDSGTYFKQLESLSGIPCQIYTGLTGTNVNDLVMILKEQ